MSDREDGNDVHQDGIDPELAEMSRQERKAAQASPSAFVTDSALSIEKLRVAAQVRKTHLARNSREDRNTDIILERLILLEAFVDNLLGDIVDAHPAQPWFSRVKGVGRENIGKVLGPIDIRKAQTISALWKFCGMHVVDGHSPKAIRGGGKLEYNKQLRSMCWRLGVSLMKGGGKFYELYAREKAHLQERYAREGKKIVKATELPTKLEKGRRIRFEPPDMISEGHVHQQALRKMIKIFLGCLWLYWRKVESLPIRDPYPIEKMGHTTIISPDEMVDRPLKKIRRKKVAA